MARRDSLAPPSPVAELSAVSAGAKSPVGLAPGSDRHLVFVDELHRHSDREVCLGAGRIRRGTIRVDVESLARDVCASSPADGFGHAAGQRGATTERSKLQMPMLYRRLKAPVVYCLPDEPHPEADGVGIDEAAVGQMAAEHLWSRGYRRFAFVGSSALGWSKGRGLGFADWLAEAHTRPESFVFTPEQVPVFWSWNVARRNHHLQSLIAGLPGLAAFLRPTMSSPALSCKPPAKTATACPKILEWSASIMIPFQMPPPVWPSAASNCPSAKSGARRHGFSKSAGWGGRPEACCACRRCGW